MQWLRKPVIASMLTPKQLGSTNRITKEVDKDLVPLMIRNSMKTLRRGRIQTFDGFGNVVSEFGPI